MVSSSSPFLVDHGGGVRTHVFVFDGFASPDAPALVDPIDETGADFEARINVDPTGMEPGEQEV